MLDYQSNVSVFRDDLNLGKPTTGLWTTAWLVYNYFNNHITIEWWTPKTLTSVREIPASKHPTAHHHLESPIRFLEDIKSCLTWKKIYVCFNYLSSSITCTFTELASLRLLVEHISWLKIMIGCSYLNTFFYLCN